MIFGFFTGLKKLSLKGLDKMPKITDTLFIKVICNLGLLNFCLSSSAPLKPEQVNFNTTFIWFSQKQKFDFFNFYVLFTKLQISVAGITALQTGLFAKTIEYFPFSGWSLFGVDVENFEKIGQSFRSHYM